MNRSLILVAVFLCASCAHPSPAPKSATDQIASNILLGDSQHPTCARGEIAYCKATRASHFPSAQPNGRCDCVPNNLFNSNSSSRVTGSSPGARIR